MTRFTYGTPGDEATIATSVGEMVEAIEELFLAHPTVQPAAAAVPGARYLDQFGTEWRSDGAAWLLSGGKRPYVRVRKSGHTAMASAAVTSAAWDVEIADDWGMHAVGAAELVAAYDGIWQLHGVITWSGNAAGKRKATFNTTAAEGTIADNVLEPYDAAEVGQPIMGPPIRMVAGNYQRVNITQNSGSSVDFMGGSGRSTLAMVMLSS